MKKKLIVLICIVAFFIVIFNKKEIKNIKFYQNINDRITLNNLYFELFILKLSVQVIIT